MREESPDFSVAESGECQPPLNDQILAIARLLKIALRLTAYDEATAAPFSIFQPLIEATQLITGYTHRWETCDPIWKSYLMASVESMGQAQKAWGLGWKTYRILPDSSHLSPDEMFCKNYQDTYITCNHCGLCNGKNQSVAIPVHGAAFKQKAFRETQS